MTDSGSRPALPPLRRLRQFMNTPAGGVVLLAALVLIIIGSAQLTGASSQRLLSLVVRGVMLGGILALGAIGLTLVSGVMKMANFAQGDLMSVGAYVALIAVTFLPQGPILTPFSFGYELLVGIVLALVVTGLVAVVLDRLIYRHLRGRRAGTVVLAMASLGAALFLRSIIYLIWGADFSFYYSGRPRPALQLFEGISVRPDQLFILGLAVVFIILIWVLLEHTRLGKAMRATADNADLARVSGINTKAVVTWTWLIGGGLAGVSGVMYGLYSQLRPEMGWFLLLPLFAGVILGTIGNPYGALAGSLIIGIAWQVSSLFLDPAYGPGVAFVLMILVLLFRPQGLFGKAGG